MSVLKIFACTLVLFTSAGSSFGSVNLFAFWAVESNGDANVHWQTTSETNNEYFVLSRSTDLVTFTLLDTLLGSNNSSIFLNYTYFDTSVISGETYYYQLLYIEFDGTEDAAPVMIFTMGNSTGLPDANYTDFHLYPNPTAGDISIDSKANVPFKVDVYSLSGQLLMSEKHNGQGPFRFHLEGPSGYYLIEVSDSNHSVTRTKVMKFR